MSIERCLIQEFDQLQKALSAKLSKQRVADVMRIFRRRFEHYAQQPNVPRAMAWEFAARDVDTFIKNQIVKRKIRFAKQKRAQDEFMELANANPGRVGKAALAKLTFDPTGEIATPNVQFQIESVKKMALTSADAVLDKFRATITGATRNKADLDNIVRELFGEGTKDKVAKEMAEALRTMFEDLRLRFNRAGGDIQKLENWGGPQTHNRRSIEQVSKDEWKQFVLERLDREKMKDFETDLPLGDQKLNDILDDVYDDIITDGFARKKPNARRVGASIATKRQESRFLIFAGADKWLEYHKRFGSGDFFQSIVHHVDAMARDIGLMEVLGPNPDATVRLMLDMMQKDVQTAVRADPGNLRRRAARRLFESQDAIISTYDTLTGRANLGQDSGWARFHGGTRNITTSAFLGGAFLSALADVGFTAVTAVQFGIPVSRVIARQLQLFTPGSAETFRLAARIGFIKEGYMSSLIASQRLQGDFMGPNWTRRISETVLRASFLTSWTDSGRVGFGMEALGLLTENAGKSFDRLPKAIQNTFRRHGITEDMWNIFRSTEKWKDGPTGATFIRVQDVARRTDAKGAWDVGNAIHRMILQETDFAVPVPDAFVRGMLNTGKRADSFWGQIGRDLTLFKSFPATIAHTHLQRMATLQNTGDRAKYFALLMITTGVMGMLGEQASQMLQGKDPLPLDPLSPEGRKGWQKGMLRAGGMGIFGDFLFSEENRYGGGILETIAGPIWGTEVPRMFQVTKGNLQKIVEDKETSFGKDFTRFAHLMTPGRSLWYARLAMERLIVDEALKAIDPGAMRDMQLRVNRTRRETGQDFYAPPGRGFPERAPRLENIFR